MDPSETIGLSKAPVVVLSLNKHGERVSKMQDVQLAQRPHISSGKYRERPLAVKGRMVIRKSQDLSPHPSQATCWPCDRGVTSLLWPLVTLQYADREALHKLAGRNTRCFLTFSRDKPENAAHTKAVDQNGEWAPIKRQSEAGGEGSYAGTTPVCRAPAIIAMANPEPSLSYTPEMNPSLPAISRDSIS